MKAFVAGATGETGRRIVQELIARNIPVLALVRDEQKARAILPPEAELVVGDVLNPASLTAALGDSTVVLCATGAIVMQSADTLFDGSIPQQKVAKVCVESLSEPSASNKIVEIVAKPEASTKTFTELFQQC